MALHTSNGSDHPFASPTLAPLMRSARKAAPSDVRISNRMMVFSQLFPSTQLSRAAIVRTTGLSKASVSQVVSDLESASILQEIGPGKQLGRGKKGTLLQVDTRHWCVISVDLSRPYLVTAAILDLTGSTMKRSELPVGRPSDITPDKVLDLCKNLSHQAPGEILGFGVAVPGIVDGNGTVLTSTSLNWKNVDLGAMLEAALGRPAIINHDAHSALLAERYFGKGTPNTLFVQLTLGVGASLLIDDAAVLGVHHQAGEIGHVTMDVNGPLCACGKHGCLESFVSTAAIRQRMLQSKDRTGILSQSGAFLAQALAFPVNLLDIDDIAVYGPPDIVGPTLLQTVETSLTKSGPSNPARHCTVRRCACGNDIALLGEGIAVVQSAIRDL
ncbi:MAG: ROK family protein [Bifidobacterium sp.]|nr:ROK family protein [Bifidobacterium sp.]MCI1864329.1 ROK family protein [Bifidobacterium sp.]